MGDTKSETAEAVIEVERVETVSYENVFEGEPGEPIWRIVLNGFCADFPTETAARNFADQIASVKEISNA